MTQKHPFGGFIGHNGHNERYRKNAGNSMQSGPKQHFANFANLWCGTRTLRKSFDGHFVRRNFWAHRNEFLGTPGMMSGTPVEGPEPHHFANWDQIVPGVTLHPEHRFRSGTLFRELYCARSYHHPEQPEPRQVRKHYFANCWSGTTEVRSGTTPFRERGPKLCPVCPIPSRGTEGTFLLVPFHVGALKQQASVSFDVGELTRFGYPVEGSKAHSKFGAYFNSYHHCRRIRQRRTIILHWKFQSAQ
jgi:hypothetical protein